MEVAGLVFGIIPLAITALEKYGEAADRLGHFYRIRREHKKWRDALSYSELILSSHLAELLVPVMDLDQDHIRKLIGDPHGQLRRDQPWEGKDEMITKVLKDRLQGSYSLYMDMLADTKKIVETITDQLALDYPSVQSKIRSPGATGFFPRVKTLFSSENRSFQWYRLKFSFKGSGGRKSLFRELEDCTNKLEKILAVSDRNKKLSSQLSSQRSSTSSLGTAAEQALSSFWKHADKLFHALASSWNCRCKAHTANLLLRDRATYSGYPDFEVLLTRQLDMHPPNSWKVRNAKIVAVEQAEKDSDPGNANISGSAPIHAPSHRDSRPVKSAMGKAGGSNVKGKTTMFVGVESSQTLTLLQVKQDDRSKVAVNSIMAAQQGHHFIRSLCTVLERPSFGLSTVQGGDSCYGFFLHNQTSYQVYETVHNRHGPINLSGADELPTMTLQSIMDRQLLRGIERSSRYGLALAIASSFVQLLNSPWLTTTLSKTNIMFVDDDDDPDADLLRWRMHMQRLPVTRPYLQLPSGMCNISMNTNTKLPPQRQASTTPPYLLIQDDPFTQLAIIIFELCFGQALRDHPIRRHYDTVAPSSHELQSNLYDLNALDALISPFGPFEKEAGVLEAKAVRWCLWGKKTIPQDQWRTGKWRAEMWANVVEPLKQCCNWMNFGKADDCEPEGACETRMHMGPAPMSGMGMVQHEHEPTLCVHYTPPPRAPPAQIGHETAGAPPTRPYSCQTPVVTKDNLKGDFEPGPGFVDPYRSQIPLTDWVSVYRGQNPVAVGTECT
ncbi:hypothetical protein QBC45DRAFT_361047 [Copromyces sp. CBS 386.78]|nr:hypothetical protein QBC45DRAFT_361047 [Copromyces sp. CBS 386.78]